MGYKFSSQEVEQIRQDLIDRIETALKLPKLSGNLAETDVRELASIADGLEKLPNIADFRFKIAILCYNGLSVKEWLNHGVMKPLVVEIERKLGSLPGKGQKMSMNQFVLSQRPALHHNRSIATAQAHS